MLRSKELRDYGIWWVDAVTLKIGSWQGWDRDGCHKPEDLLREEAEGSH